MRIYCMQSVTFNHPNDYDTKYKVEANKFVDVPEWVADSDMFKLLQVSKKVTIINGTKDVSSIEKADGKIVAEELVKTEAVDEPEVEPEYEKMKAKELYSICLEKGIEAEEKQSKEYYLNLLK